MSGPPYLGGAGAVARWCKANPGARCHHGLAWEVCAWCRRDLAYYGVPAPTYTCRSCKRTRRLAEMATTIRSVFAGKKRTIADAVSLYCDDCLSDRREQRAEKATFEEPRTYDDRLAEGFAMLEQAEFVA